MKKPYKRKESIITIIGTSYIENLVPEMVEKCFEIYSKRDFSKKNFQVSVLENSYATAGIILTILAIEAYRNRIYYLEKRKVSGDVPKDLATLFKERDPNFNCEEFRKFISEAFILRDVIVHNHIYKVDVYFDEEYDMLGHNQTLLEGYGDTKFRTLSSSRTKRTLNLNLNVQSAKIGFEDLFVILVMFDTFVGISNKLLSRSHVPFNFWYEIEKQGTQDFFKFLTLFYVKIGNMKYKRKIDKIFTNMRVLFGGNLNSIQDYFITNVCPKCATIGFHRFDNSNSCNKCGLKISLIHSNV